MPPFSRRFRRAVYARRKRNAERIIRSGVAAVGVGVQSAVYTYTAAKACVAKNIKLDIGASENGHFYLGEPIISKSAYWSFYYATSIIKERFYLGEPSIYDSEYKTRYIGYFGIKSNTPTPLYYSTPK